MIIVKKPLYRILALLMVFMLFQGCKSYKEATSLEQASKVDEKEYVKVTMVNGDEYVYEAIDYSENTYYGVKTVNGEKVKTILLKDDVLKVERQNEKSSNFFGTVGIAIGIVSIILGIFML